MIILFIGFMIAIFVISNQLIRYEKVLNFEIIEEYVYYSYRDATFKECLSNLDYEESSVLRVNKSKPTSIVFTSKYLYLQFLLVCAFDMLLAIGIFQVIKNPKKFEARWITDWIP